MEKEKNFEWLVNYCKERYCKVYIFDRGPGFQTERNADRFEVWLDCMRKDWRTYVSSSKISYKPTRQEAINSAWAEVIRKANSWSKKIPGYEKRYGKNKSRDIPIKSTPIKPSDINVKKHFFNAFNNYDTEISANWLVRLAQENGDWRNFTQVEINIFFQKKFPGVDFSFNRLINEDGPSPIIKNNDGSFSFTHDFIASCFKSSPAM